MKVVREKSREDLSRESAMAEVGHEKSFSDPADDRRNIFDTLTDMITIHDADFNIVRANTAAEKMLGLPQPHPTGAKCFTFYHGSDSPPEGCPSCGCIRTGEPALFEMYEPHLNMFMEIRVIPRFDDAGRRAGLIHIVRDITQRKINEEELRLHRHHLERLVKKRAAELTAANDRLYFEIAERRRAENEKKELIGSLQDALANIKTLRGLLPICACCSKIKDEEGVWKKVDAYIKEHSDTSFTHGICPECYEKMRRRT